MTPIQTYVRSVAQESINNFEQHLQKTLLGPLFFRKDFPAEEIVRIRNPYKDKEDIKEPNTTTSYILTLDKAELQNLNSNYIAPPELQMTAALKLDPTDSLETLAEKIDERLALSLIKMVPDLMHRCVKTISNVIGKASWDEFAIAHNAHMLQQLEPVAAEQRLIASKKSKGALEKSSSAIGDNEKLKYKLLSTAFTDDKLEPANRYKEDFIVVTTLQEGEPAGYYGFREPNIKIENGHVVIVLQLYVILFNRNNIFVYA